MTREEEPARMELRLHDGRIVALDMADVKNLGPMLAACFAMAKATDIETGLDMLTIAHIGGAQKGAQGRDALDAAWPGARAAFIIECAFRGCRARDSAHLARLAEEGLPPHP